MNTWKTFRCQNYITLNLHRLALRFKLTGAARGKPLGGVKDDGRH